MADQAYFTAVKFTALDEEKGNQTCKMSLVIFRINTLLQVGT